MAGYWRRPPGEESNSFPHLRSGNPRRECPPAEALPDPPNCGRRGPTRSRENLHKSLPRRSLPDPWQGHCKTAICATRHRVVWKDRRRQRHLVSNCEEGERSYVKENAGDFGARDDSGKWAVAHTRARSSSATVGTTARNSTIEKKTTKAATRRWWMTWPLGLPAKSSLSGRRVAIGSSDLPKTFW